MATPMDELKNPAYGLYLFIDEPFRVLNVVALFQQQVHPGVNLINQLWP
jgi:hypothetical protein